MLKLSHSKARALVEAGGQKERRHSGEPHLDGGGDKKLLLFEAELLALVGSIVGIQNAAHGLRPLPRQDGLPSRSITP